MEVRVSMQKWKWKLFPFSTLSLPKYAACSTLVSVLENFNDVQMRSGEHLTWNADVCCQVSEKTSVERARPQNRAILVAPPTRPSVPAHPPICVFPALFAFDRISSVHSPNGFETDFLSKIDSLDVVCLCHKSVLIFVSLFLVVFTFPVGMSAPTF